MKYFSRLSKKLSDVLKKKKKKERQKESHVDQYIILLGQYV